MIGIFDSGSGGLTVLKAVRERAPELDIIYFGDTKNAPYGNKSREELGALTMRGFEILKKNGATHFVSACNSVSASVTERLLKPLRIFPNEVIEMSGPTVRSVLGMDHGRILLTATVATIESEMYQNAFDAHGVLIATLPIPDLAGAIEGGESEDTLRGIIRAAILHADPFDTLVLGCTHFPLVSDLFLEVLSELGQAPAIVDPAEPVSEEAVRRFGNERGEGTLTILVSNNLTQFRVRLAEMLPGTSYSLQVV